MQGGIGRHLADRCPLDADALHAQASAATRLHDFGPDDYRERLEFYWLRCTRSTACMARAG